MTPIGMVLLAVILLHPDVDSVLPSPGSRRKSPKKESEECKITDVKKNSWSKFSLIVRNLQNQIFYPTKVFTLRCTLLFRS